MRNFEFSHPVMYLNLDDCPFGYRFSGFGSGPSAHMDHSPTVRISNGSPGMWILRHYRLLVSRLVEVKIFEKFF